MFTYNENNRIISLMNREKVKYRSVQMNEVLSAVLSYYDMTYIQLINESRLSSVVRKRKMVAFIASLFAITHRDIAEAMQRERSTITGQIEDMRHDMRLYPTIKEDIDRIVKVLTKYEVENGSERSEGEV